MYLYLRHPNPQTGELKAQAPPSLLHPRMLLFDLPSKSADLWMGSHDWTARALTGVSVEASLTVQLGRRSRLYRNARGFLEAIQSSCERFDPKAVPYYRWLQGRDAEEPIWVLELSGSRSALVGKRRLTVFGKTEEDYRNLRSVGKNIVISLQDETTGEEFLREAAIIDMGRLPRAGVRFDSRLYARQDGSQRPELKGPKLPPQEILSGSSSWATLAVLEELSGASFEVPPTQRWLPVENGPGGAEVRDDLRDWFPRPDKPLVQRAVPRSVFERRESGSASVAPRRASMPKLLRRKIVRAKRRSGLRFTLRRAKQSHEDRQEALPRQRARLTRPSSSPTGR